MESAARTPAPRGGERASLGEERPH
jgi:hypothetical protein